VTGPGKTRQSCPPKPGATPTQAGGWRQTGRRHDRLSHILVGALISLVLGFDLLSVYAREFMGTPVAVGSVISIGMVGGLCLIAMILAAALYYVLKVNTAPRDAPESPDHG